MSTPRADFSLEELRQFLEQQQEGPPGYRSAKEWAELWGCCVRRAREMMQEANRRGWLLVDRERITRIDGRPGWQPVYAFQFPEDDESAGGQVVG